VSAVTQLQTRQGNRRQLWLLVLLFALPPLAAWLFYFNPQWLPTGRTNHGELLEPISMETMALRSTDGSAFDWEPLRDLWTLTLVAEGECNAQCTEQLIKLRQIRRALGANRQRVERLLILLPDTAGELDVPNLEGLEGTRLALVPETERDAIQGLFAGAEAARDQQLLIIDPRVELMMRHDLSQITSKQVLQDLERLLKASQNWARGGQYGHQ